MAPTTELNGLIGISIQVIVRHSWQIDRLGMSIELNFGSGVHNSNVIDRTCTLVVGVFYDGIYLICIGPVVVIEILIASAYLARIMKLCTSLVKTMTGCNYRPLGNDGSDTVVDPSWSCVVTKTDQPRELK